MVFPIWSFSGGSRCLSPSLTWSDLNSILCFHNWVVCIFSAQLFNPTADTYHFIHGSLYWYVCSLIAKYLRAMCWQILQLPHLSDSPVHFQVVDNLKLETWFLHPVTLRLLSSCILFPTHSEVRTGGWGWRSVLICLLLTLLVRVRFLPQGWGDGWPRDIHHWTEEIDNRLFLTYTHNLGEEGTTCHARLYGACPGRKWATRDCGRWVL